MYKTIFFLLLSFVIITGLCSADEIISTCGRLDYDLNTEINDNTDLISYILSKQNLTRKDIHISRHSAENLIRKSTNGIISPHYIQCWENPFYFPHFTKRICGEAGNNWKGENGMYNILLFSQERTGYAVGRLNKYLPVMEVSDERPVEKALQKICKYLYGKDFKEKTFLCSISGKNYELKIYSSSLSSSDPFSGIPLKVQKLTAEYLLSHLHAAKYRNLAFREIPKDKLKQLYNTGRYHFLSSKDNSDKTFLSMVEEETGEDSPELEYDMARKCDYYDLYWGGLPIVVNMIKIKSFLSDPREDAAKNSEGKDIPGTPIDISKINFEFDTPFGLFAFSGGADSNDYDGDKYFAIIDAGGNDTYSGSVASSLPDRPVGTLIDFAGNDVYISTKDDPSSQGFGMMGYGMLLDCKGDDMYSSYDNSQGGSFFGVGLLWDEGGNDSFEGRTMTQGAASYGVANLVNIGGNDTYYCFQCGQAFGYVGGCGILIDTEGDDIYTGETGEEEPEKNLINSADKGHDNKRNYSFVQGAGWGKRGDLASGHSMGGGTGILIDMSGNDSYTCGVYGQATGYWYGTGILNDLKGNDIYKGSFYVQSGTAHMGMTELLDEDGNDTYRVWKAISQGGAHDFSLSWFIDKKGNDKYLCFEEDDEKGTDGKLTGAKIKTSGGVMIGSAITNSFGAHIDYEGDDTYEVVNSTTLGYCLQRSGAESFRYDEWTCGIMIDRGGNDTYIRNIDTMVEKYVPMGWPRLSNDSIWKEICQPGNVKYSFGMGLDYTKGKVPEAEY